MISSSGRSSRHLLFLGTFLALCLLAACSGAGQATQDSSLPVTETPAELVAQPIQPSPVSTQTLQPTATHTPTAVPPTETPQPSPTATSSPTVTATPLPPTPEIEVAEGEVVFEKEIDGVQVAAAVPEHVVPILEAGRVGTGSIEGVRKAGWRVGGDACSEPQSLDR